MEFDAVALYLSQAVIRLLKDENIPIVTEYSLYRKTSPLVSEREYRGVKLTQPPARWSTGHLSGLIRTLEKRRALVPDEDFKSGVWRVVQSAQALTAEEAVCTVDPFAYVSHLSAMQRYGLTDRSPESLHVTTPARPLWTQLRDNAMEREGWRSEMDHPVLTRIGFKHEVRRRPVIRHETSHPAQPIAIAGSATRIAGVGRVFTDMLGQPDLCGGIYHVIDCYHRHAADWLDDIINSVSSMESAIIKVRAGYLLEEIVGVEDRRIDQWRKYAQRGGSRKLDPNEPYGNAYSEKWMLAINV